MKQPVGVIKIAAGAKERLDWADTLKFLGIFAVYLGHLGNAGGRFYLFVYTFHFPLFFFAGGFFAPHKVPAQKGKKLFLQE